MANRKRYSWKLLNTVDLNQRLWITHLIFLGFDLLPVLYVLVFLPFSKITLAMLMLVGFIGMQVYRFRRGYWWSWCVLYVYTGLKWFAQLILFIQLLHYANMDTIVASIYLATIVFFVLATILLRGMVRYRILGFHGVTKRAFWIATSIVLLGVVSYLVVY